MTDVRLLECQVVTDVYLNSIKGKLIAYKKKAIKHMESLYVLRTSDKYPGYDYENKTHRDPFQPISRGWVSIPSLKPADCLKNGHRHSRQIFELFHSTNERFYNMRRGKKWICFRFSTLPKRFFVFGVCPFFLANISQ